MAVPPKSQASYPLAGARATSWKSVADASAAKLAAQKDAALPSERDALQTLADLFTFAKSAQAVDAGIDSGNSMFKGQPRPQRCTRVVGSHGPCRLPLRRAEEALGACTFHRAAHNVANAGIDPDTVYLDSPVAETVANRLKALKI